MRPRAGVAALAVAVVALGTASLFRGGYSPDEEFTVFAVRGIRAHGLPLLPSGLLYDRGLLYSYLSWLAAALTGQELPAFRALSLLSAAAALAVGYRLVSWVASPAAGIAATLLVAASLPFWAVATTGRFYAPFLLTVLGVLAVVTIRVTPRPGSAREASKTSRASLRIGAALAFLAFLCRLTHELAFTLMIVPVAGLALSWLERPAHGHAGRARALPVREWAAVATALAAGLVAAQALLMALHFVLPRGDGGTMIQRFFLWQVLNLLERPHGGPLGVIVSVVVVALLLLPRRATAILVTGVCAGVTALVSAVFLERVGGADGVFLLDTAGSGLAYPLDMFWHLADTHPLLLAVAIGTLAARLAGLGGEWPPGERAAHLAWVGWVLWFGIIDSGITVNYVLLPTVCLLAAIGLDLVAIGQQAAAVRPGPVAGLTRAALLGVALLVAADQWPGTGSPGSRLAVARPTIDVAGIDAVRGALQPADRVACTDELACLLLVGRVDYWLALDDYVRERFLVRRGPVDVGVYAGAPAAFRPADLFGTREAPSRGRVLVVDVFKDYAVGNSAAWLPRAVDADRLELRAWLVTPQARVAEILTGPPRPMP